MTWTLLIATGMWAFLAAFQAASQSNAADHPAAKTTRALVRVAPPDIQRGDRVAVRVISGGVLLTFGAEAASAAHIGESIIVLNPENGRRFVGRVEDKGKVIVRK